MKIKNCLLSILIIFVLFTLCMFSSCSNANNNPDVISEDNDTKNKKEEEVKKLEEEKKKKEEEVKKIEDEIKKLEEEKQLHKDEIKKLEEEKKLYEDEIKKLEEEKKKHDEEVNKLEEEKNKQEEVAKIIIDSPYVYHEPLYSSIDQSESYIEFSTVEKQYDGMKFLGTEVYYKIYDSPSRLISEYSSINAAATSENATNHSVDRMIVTYKYQPLRSSDNPVTNILIPSTGSNRKIKIRLSNYNDVYKAELTVAGTKMGIPVRSVVKNPAFSFKELVGTDSLPKSGDFDYSYTSTSSDITEFYVCMYAVAVAQDATYTRQYSNVVYLGSISIDLY